MKAAPNFLIWFAVTCACLIIGSCTVKCLVLDWQNVPSAKTQEVIHG